MLNCVNETASDGFALEELYLFAARLQQRRADIPENALNCVRPLT
ncbi:hypothetical protein D7D26_01200 [Pyramidobacter sp. CG50-2]|nr:hypothetical protein D7D26_01200 [Pyramidobacter sp. CG50-2]